MDREYNKNNLFSIVLKGEKEMRLFLNQRYIEPGYLAKTDEGVDLNVTIKGEIDTGNAGIYTLEYIAIYKNKIKKETRTVEVIPLEGTL